MIMANITTANAKN